MPRKTKSTKPKRKYTRRAGARGPPSAKQLAVREKFRQGVLAYKEYKRANPSGTKKITVFIREAF